MKVHRRRRRLNRRLHQKRAMPGPFAIEELGDGIYYYHHVRTADVPVLERLGGTRMNGSSDILVTPQQYQRFCVKKGQKWHY